MLEFSANADAQVRIGNSTRQLHEEAEATAPVPTIGLAGRAQPLSQLWLDVEARFLPGVQFDNIEGRWRIDYASNGFGAFDQTIVL